MNDLVTAVPRLLGEAAEASPLLGYAAIALAMLLETVVAPMPAELILPFSGFLVHQGRLELVPVILAGVVGSVLGAWCWYGLGLGANYKRVMALLEPIAGVLIGGIVSLAAGALLLWLWRRR